MKTSLLRLPATALALAGLLFGCGGGGSGGGGGGGNSPAPAPLTSNSMTVTVTGGYLDNFPNSLVATVTICSPGSTSCLNIPDVLVDTGSSGLRLLASAVRGLTLPGQSGAASGNALYECYGVQDGVVWGPVVQADVRLAGEKASSIGVQIIDDLGINVGIPSPCASQGANLSSKTALGVNGILGIGTFLQDCGTDCVGQTAAVYFSCSNSGTCTDIPLALAQQVSNPAAFFAQDNNGVIIQLPALSGDGAISSTGTLIFGIGTQTNNALGTNAIKLSVPSSGATAGYFSATYNGITLTNSFIDSGSPGLFFDDASLPLCSLSGVASGYYCPGSSTSASTRSISVKVNGGATTLNLQVANAEYLFGAASASLNVFPTLAGPTEGTVTQSFVLGLPFFFGRSVYTAFESRNTEGPYFAFQPYP